jgi:peptidoglycan/xylan/chitin deacetylase (PgdA/CDA1 family)
MERAPDYIMNILPVVYRRLFPSLIFRTNSSDIHLTFDDGPHPVATPKVLKILKEYQVKATFFLLGRNIIRFPDVAQQILSEGHQIGNHSYSHENLFFKRRKAIENDILHAEECIQQVLNIRATLFRPPYGYVNRSLVKVVRQMKMECILWNFDSKDFAGTKTSDLIRKFQKGTPPGSILLFHDNELTVSRITSYLPPFLDALHTSRTLISPLVL